MARSHKHPNRRNDAQSTRDEQIRIHLERAVVDLRAAHKLMNHDENYHFIDKVCKNLRKIYVRHGGDYRNS